MNFGIFCAREIIFLESFNLITREGKYLQNVSGYDIRSAAKTTFDFLAFTFWKSKPERHQKWIINKIWFFLWIQYLVNVKSEYKLWVFIQLELAIIVFVILKPIVAGILDNNLKWKTRKQYGTFHFCLISNLDKYSPW